MQVYTRAGPPWYAPTIALASLAWVLSRRDIYVYRLAQQRMHSESLLSFALQQIGPLLTSNFAPNLIVGSSSRETLLIFHFDIRLPLPLTFYFNIVIHKPFPHSGPTWVLVIPSNYNPNRVETIHTDSLSFALSKAPILNFYNTAQVNIEYHSKTYEVSAIFVYNPPSLNTKTPCVVGTDGTGRCRPVFTIDDTHTNRTRAFLKDKIDASSISRSCGEKIV